MAEKYNSVSFKPLFHVLQVPLVENLDNKSQLVRKTLPAVAKSMQLILNLTKI